MVIQGPGSLHLWLCGTLRSQSPLLLAAVKRNREKERCFSTLSARNVNIFGRTSHMALTSHKGD